MEVSPGVGWLGWSGPSGWDRGHQIVLDRGLEVAGFGGSGEEIAEPALGQARLGLHRGLEIGQIAIVGEGQDHGVTLGLGEEAIWEVSLGLGWVIGLRRRRGRRRLPRPPHPKPETPGGSSHDPGNSALGGIEKGHAIHGILGQVVVDRLRDLHDRALAEGQVMTAAEVVLNALGQGHEELALGAGSRVAWSVCRPGT